MFIKFSVKIAIILMKTKKKTILPYKEGETNIFLFAAFTAILHLYTYTK